MFCLKKGEKEVILSPNNNKVLTLDLLTYESISNKRNQKHCAAWQCG